MNKEQEGEPQQEPRKIHPTHFPVIKIPLKDDGRESAYEWVPSGNGRLKRVPKKVEGKTPCSKNIV